MNRLYDKAVEAAQKARPMNLLAGTIKAQLVDLGAYTPNFSTDEFLAAVPSGARIGTAATLGSKSITARVFDAADVSITGISGAPSIEAVILFEDTGDAATSPLLAYIDTATGLPVAAGATQVDIAWSNGSDKIFKL